MVWTSLFGIVTIVLLAWAMGFKRDPALADGEAAARLAADAVHGFAPAEAVVAAGGRAALVAGRDGRVALVRPFGDRWVVRLVNGAAAEVADGRLTLRLAEAMFPPASLDLGADARAWANRL